MNGCVENFHPRIKGMLIIIRDIKFPSSQQKTTQKMVENTTLTMYYVGVRACTCSVITPQFVNCKYLKKFITIFIYLYLMQYYAFINISTFAQID